MILSPSTQLHLLVDIHSSFCPCLVPSHFWSDKLIFAEQRLVHISVACPPFPNTQTLLHLFLKHSEIHTVLVSRSANHDSLFEMGIKQKMVDVIF